MARRGASSLQREIRASAHRIGLAAAAAASDTAAASATAANTTDGADRASDSGGKPAALAQPPRFSTRWIRLIGVGYTCVDAAATAAAAAASQR